MRCDFYSRGLTEHQASGNIKADFILWVSYGGYPQQGYPPQQYGGYNQGPPVGDLLILD